MIIQDTEQRIRTLKKLMVTDDYPLVSPLAPSKLAEFMTRTPPDEWHGLKKKVYEEIQLLLRRRPDYAYMFTCLDGLEYNGLTLYNLAQAEHGEPLWSNIFIRNLEVRDNDIYVDPNLKDNVLIGEDGMSIFAYNFIDDCFQIQDKASTSYIIESHEKFSDFLSALIDTVS
ncbi:hypothetical protein RJ498_001311 [Pluralibacter gergoviae]